ncbi:MAG: agmatinase [bacterium]
MGYDFLEASNDIDFGDIVIVGYPFDSTSSFRSGSRNGPFSLRYHSWNLETFSPYRKTDIHTKRYSDIGDLELPFGDVEKANSMIYENTKRLLKMKKQIISLGGEHSITYPIIKAYSESFDDFVMVVFDAHADLREDYQGVKFSHACVVRNCSNLITTKRICQIGIRSYTEEEWKFSKNMLYFSDTIEGFDFSILKNKKIYISIDIDALDPSIVPGTGTPEPGGIFFKNFIDFLVEFRNFDVIGCDLVELSPDYDQSAVSSITAAKIVRELILLL